MIMSLILLILNQFLSRYPSFLNEIEKTTTTRGFIIIMTPSGKHTESQIVRCEILHQMLS